MLFNSLAFFVFFPVTLTLYYLARPWKTQKAILLVGSYLFYAAWNPPFVLLLWLSTVVDWFAAARLEKEERTGRRRLYLMLSLAVNLGLLGYFKYGGFLLENFTQLMSMLGVSVQPVTGLDIVLPVGISFYTFQTLSYTLDVYFKRGHRSKSFLDFALYVTFFPQLVAGPIVRANHFLPQCEEPKRFEMGALTWGMFLITLGLFQKVVLADALLAPTSEAVFGWAKGPLAPLDAWMGVLAFSGQIFFDFSGYSTCAIGVGFCTGFSLPDNFRFPYAAEGFADFWRRWHITLSTWLRDYLYIPLGGNRKGPPREMINIMIVMLVGGLWHGASWTFVVWGGLHGIYLLVERWVRKVRGESARPPSAVSRVALALLTIFLVNIAWVFFRADTFGSAALILASMFGLPEGGAKILSGLATLKVAVVVGGLYATHIAMRKSSLEAVLERIPSPLQVVFWAFMLFSIVITQGGGDAFIYFQF